MIVGRYFKLLLLLLLCLLKSNNIDISLLYSHHHRWPGTALYTGAVSPSARPILTQNFRMEGYTNNKCTKNCS